MSGEQTEWCIFQARDGYWHFYPEDWEGRPEDFSGGHLTLGAAEEGLEDWKRTAAAEEEERARVQAGLQGEGGDR